MYSEQEIIEFANKHDYFGVEYLGEYLGGKIYEAIYRNDDNIYYIGLPAFILLKEKELIWIHDKKSLEILGHFYPDDE